MRKKLFVLVITLSLLLSGLLAAVGGEATKGKESVGKGIEEIETQSAQEIHDWDDLGAVRDDLDGNYVLMNDLDENTDGYEELVDTEEGWEPIGEDGSPYMGKFDGNGYEIRDLYINRSPSDEIGLFGRIDNIAEITDVGLVDANVSGDRFVGIVAGRNNGGFISETYAMGTSTGYWNTGGLLGSNVGDGIVSSSYTNVDVIGAHRAGGLVGFSGETITNSYATGNVSGDEYVGGLVGWNEANVSNCYATGDVSGDEYVGGLVGGSSIFSTVSSSFWDTENSEINTSEGGTGLTTYEMTGEDAQDNMDGFDFENSWETVEKDHVDADEDGYPILQELSREEQLKSQNVYREDEILSNYWWLIILILIVAVIAIGIAITWSKKKPRVQQPSQQWQRPPSSQRKRPPQQQPAQQQKPPSQEPPSEQQIPRDVPKEKALMELSELSGVGPSKAEQLYESGFRTLEDLQGVTKEELQEVKGIGPGLSEKILNSLEEFK